MRINREKVVGYDSATAFVKALGVRALNDPEDDVGLVVEKPPQTVKLACFFFFCDGLRFKMTLH